MTPKFDIRPPNLLTSAATLLDKATVILSQLPNPTSVISEGREIATQVASLANQQATGIAEEGEDQVKHAVVKQGLSKGTIAGIVCAVVIGIALFIGAFLFNKRRNRPPRA